MNASDEVIEHSCTCIRDGETFWTVSSGNDVVAVAGPGARRWFELETDDCARRLKSARDREVWAIDDPVLGPVVAKVSRLAGVGAWMKTRLIGTPAKREGVATRIAFELGVGARLVAYGRRRTLQGLQVQSVLLTEYVESAAALDEAWRQAAQAGVTSRCAGRWSLIRDAAHSVARMHAGRLVHRDLHPRNILVRDGQASGPSRVVVVDLLGAGWSRPVTVKRAASNLAQLDQHFHRVATRADRLRFVKEYLRFLASLSARDAVPNIRELLMQTAAHAVRHRRGLARDRDRRLRGDGRYFERMTLSKHWRATVLLRDGRRHVQRRRMDFEMTPDQWRSVLLRVMEDVESATSSGLEPTGQEQLGGTDLRDVPRASAIRADQNRHCTDAAPTGTTEVRITVAAAHEGSSKVDPLLCAAKVYVARSLVERMTWAVTGSPAAREFREIHRLRHRDEQASLAYAVLERREHGLPALAILLTDQMDQSAS